MKLSLSTIKTFIKTLKTKKTDIFHIKTPKKKTLKNKKFKKT